MLTAAQLDILYREVSTLYQQGLLGSPTYYNEIATTIPVAGSQITMAFLDRLPMFREWKGNRVINEPFAHSRSIVMKPWENTFSVDLFQLSDENAPLFSSSVQTFGAATAKWQDQMLTGFLKKEAATVLGYDGVPVYSTAHPILGGVTGGVPSGTPATQSNLATSTALTYQNFIDVYQDMISWVGADGAPMASIPDTLMVSPQLYGTAKLILESDIIAGAAFTATSNASQTNVWKNIVKLMVNPWLVSMPNNWFLLNTSMPMKPFAIFNREAPTMAALTSPTDPNVFLNHKLVWGAQARGNAAETVWWLSYAATSEASYYPA